MGFQLETVACSGALMRGLCGLYEVQNSCGALNVEAEDNEEQRQEEREGTPLHQVGYDGDGGGLKRHEDHGYEGFHLPPLLDPPDHSHRRALQM